MNKQQLPKKLYVVLHPHTVLIASQLQPEHFATHYMSGPSRHYKGKAIFAEIEPTFRHAFFPIQNMFDELIPHDDGRPKATKFIKTYRVLEHLDLSKIKSVYLANSNGLCLPLQKGDLYAGLRNSPDDTIHFFAEITPMKMLTLSRLNYKIFGQYVTNPKHSKGAPAICYTTINCDVSALFKYAAYVKEVTARMLPGVDIEKLKGAIESLQNNPEKKTKGILLEADLNNISYKYLRDGIVLCNSEQMVIFTIPPLDDIEKKHPEFFKSL